LPSTSETKADLLKQLAAKVGYRIEHVDHLHGGQVAGSIAHDGDLDTSNLLAAWYGLLAKEQNILAFHEHPDGQDHLHTWTTAARPQNLQAAAQRLGLPHFKLGVNGRVYAFDPGGKNVAKILTLAKNSRSADHAVFKGQGNLMGGMSGPASKARAAYRHIIEGYSRASNSSTDPGPTAPAATGTTDLHTPGVK